MARLVNVLPLLVIAIICVVRGACPNNCHGRGKCTNENTCICDDSFSGSPDCSTRKCPSGAAWADKAIAVNTAHSTSECSGQGICNKQEGTCTCFQGFEGHACERTACSCNGHGTCLTIESMYELFSPRVTSTVVDPYALWDGRSTTSCVCDYGYTGQACNLRMCPKGDDPLTPFTDYRSIIISTGADDGVMTGNFRFSFFGQSIPLPADSTTWNDAKCEAVFQTMPNIQKVECSVGRPSDHHGSTEFFIEILEFPTFPFENNIYQNNGNPPNSAFVCDTTAVIGTNSARCSVTDVAGTSFPEYSYCSNRGKCNFLTGRCACYSNFTNANCDTFNFGIRELETSITEDIFVLTNDDVSFTGNVLRLQTSYNGTAAFNYITVEDNYREIMTMDGIGNINLNFGGLTIHGYDGNGGQTIAAGGLTVTGGLTVNSEGMTMTGGFTVYSGGMEILGGGLTVTDGMTVSSGGMEVLQGLTVSSGGLRVMNTGMIIYDNGLTVIAGGFYIGGSGLTIRTGGLQVTNGVTIWSYGIVVNNAGITVGSGGLTANGGVTVSSEGLTVTGGVTVNSGGIYVNTGGVTIGNDGLSVSGGMSIDAGGLTITGGATVNSGGLSVSGGMTISDSGMLVEGGGGGVTGGMTVHSLGLVVTGGSTINSGGMYIDAGGMTVASGNVAVTGGGLAVSSGIEVTGGVSVHTGGMLITNGLTVFSGGFYVQAGGGTVAAGGLEVTGGATINSGGMGVTGGIVVDTNGMMVSAGGVTVSSDGLEVTGGVTVFDSGLSVTGGVTVNTLGLRVTGGATVSTGGLEVTAGGLTIAAGGLIVTGGITVNSDGIDITGGATINSGGMQVTGGLTVSTGGLSVVGGHTISSGGLRVTGGTTISSGGLVVTGGMTLNTGGLAVTDGVSIFAGGLRVTGGATVNTLGLFVAGGMSVQGGAVVTGGATIGTGGLQVSAGGVTVSSSGLFITAGGLTVNTGGILVTGGMTIISLGLEATGGLTVNTGGAVIVSGGMSVLADGMSVSGGLAVASGGLEATGGMSVLSTGARVTGGVTVHSSGLVVSAGGATISAGGLTVADGIQLTGVSSLVVTGGITVNSGGLLVTGGLTVQTAGLYVSSQGVTIASGGVVVTGGLTVNSGGIVVTGGFTVSSGGLSVSGPVTIEDAGIVSASGISIRSNGLIVTGGLTVDEGGMIVTGGMSVFGDTYLQFTPTVFSDERLKTNIKRLSDPLDKVSKLRGVYFNWIKDEPSGMRFDDKRHVGVLAQEVQAVLPEVVHSTKNGRYLSVRYAELVPLLLEAIRELDERIAASEEFFQLSGAKRASPFPDVLSDEKVDMPEIDVQEVMERKGTVSLPATDSLPFDLKIVPAAAKTGGEESAHKASAAVDQIIVTDAQAAALRGSIGKTSSPHLHSNILVAETDSLAVASLGPDTDLLTAAGVGVAWEEEEGPAEPDLTERASAAFKTQSITAAAGSGALLTEQALPTGTSLPGSDHGCAAKIGSKVDALESKASVLLERNAEMRTRLENLLQIGIEVERKSTGVLPGGAAQREEADQAKGDRHVLGAQQKRPGMKSFLRQVFGL